MARNRFDVDETLETPFNIKHLLRAGVYIKRHKQKMILSLVFLRHFRRVRAWHPLSSSRPP